jgi:hypothetical protein
VENLEVRHPELLKVHLVVELFGDHRWAKVQCGSGPLALYHELSVWTRPEG